MARRKQRTLRELLQQKRDSLRPPTTTELGRLLGVDQSTASRWLRGLPPDIDRAPVLAEVLDLTVTEAEQLILAARRQQSVMDRLESIEETLLTVLERLAAIEERLREK